MKIQQLNQTYNTNNKLSFKAHLRIGTEHFLETKPDEDIKFLQNINSVLDSTTDTKKDSVTVVTHDFIKIKDKENKEFVIKVPSLNHIEITPIERFEKYGKQGTYGFDNAAKLFEKAQNSAPQEKQKLLEVRKNLIGIITKVKVIQQERNLMEYAKLYDEFQVKLLDILQNIADDNNMKINEVIEPSKDFLVNHKGTMVCNIESTSFFTRAAQQTTQDYLKEREVDAMYEYRGLNNPKNEKLDLFHLAESHKADCCSDPNCPHNASKKQPFDL